MTERFNKGYALLIGVGESAYYKPLSLPVTVKDTQAIYAALIDPNLCAYPDDKEHILVLNNEEATRERILNGLKWLEEKAKADSGATVLVYYSGHGWVNQTNNRYYLLPHEVNPLDIPSSALSSEDFTNALRGIRSEGLLVVLDCCHAAGMATSKDGAADITILPKEFAEISPSESKGFIDSLKQGQGKGRVVFASSKAKQKSWYRDNSIYTYHFIEALQGADNKPGDTEVRVSNLMHHLGKAVPETAKKLRNAQQTPWFDMGTEDFAIALLRGGKGLPDKGWDAVRSEAEERIIKSAEVIIERIEGKNVKNIVGSIKGDNIQVGDRTN